MAGLRTTLIILALLTMCATCSALKSKITPFHYLNLPNRTNFDDGFHQLIRRALFDVDFASASSMEVVCQALSEAARDERSDSAQREVCQQVLDLSLDQDSCSRPMLEIFQSVWAQMIANFGHGLGRFYTYFRVFGQRRFGLCAARVAREFRDESSALNSDSAQIFDDFLKLYQATFGLVGPEQSSLTVLQTTLSTFDITEDQFNGTRMLLAAMEIARLDLESQPLDSDGAVSFIRSFMLARCEQLHENQPLGFALTSVAWARCLGAELEYEPKLLVLQEYKRLCLAWTRADALVHTEENVRRHLRSL